MSKKENIKPEQAEILNELKELISKPRKPKKQIQFVEKIENDTLGVKVEDGDIVGLGLYGCKLVMFPESITNLKSLQVLNLGDNKLKNLPESISKLKKLIHLNLRYNQLKELPKTIGELKSLKVLYLRLNELTTLPESIGNLSSLQKLRLWENKLTTLPESITTLKSLKVLSLGNNQLSALPETMGNLQSLEKLNLYKNNLTTLPESIGGLKSLIELDLEDNQLNTLPRSMWQLEKLTILELNGNSWEGEWEEIVKRDIPAIRDFCKQKATIDIFISHAVDEFKEYKVNELADYLKNKEEINKVYFCEEDLKGNIDAWMKETVPKCQLMLFIGTQRSIFDSEDCAVERHLALKNRIPIIPIKGLNASWDDLAKIGLSRELGVEFDEGNLEKMHEDLYKYIYKLKKEIDLTREKLDQIENSFLNTIDLINANLNSEGYRRIYEDKFSEIEALKQDFASKKITFKKFIIELIQILDSS